VNVGRQVSVEGSGSEVAETEMAQQGRRAAPAKAGVQRAERYVAAGASEAQAA